MASAGEDDTVCVYHLLDMAGHRSFGTLLLIPSLIVISPISGIPGIPTLTGIIIVLIAGQILLGRSAIWLPQRLQRRCINQHRLRSAVTFLYPAARVADHMVRPRLSSFVGGPFTRMIAAQCVILGLLMPPLEVVPFATSLFATAVAAFALALVAHDGVLALIGFAVTATGVYFGLQAFM